MMTVDDSDDSTFLQDANQGKSRTFVPHTPQTNNLQHVVETYSPTTCPESSL